MKLGRSLDMVKEILTVQQVFDKLINEYVATIQKWLL
jgi:hypothetical protein